MQIFDGIKLLLQLYPIATDIDKYRTVYQIFIQEHKFAEMAPLQ